MFDVCWVVCVCPCMCLCKRVSESQPSSFVANLSIVHAYYAISSIFVANVFKLTITFTNARGTHKKQQMKKKKLNEMQTHRSNMCTSSHAFWILYAIDFVIVCPLLISLNACRVCGLLFFILSCHIHIAITFFVNLLRTTHAFHNNNC